MSDESSVASAHLLPIEPAAVDLRGELVLATIPSAVAELLASPLATMRLLAVAPVVSVSTMPLRAELTAAVTPAACELIAAMISPSVSAADQIDDRRHIVAIGDVDSPKRAEPLAALAGSKPACRAVRSRAAGP